MHRTWKIWLLAVMVALLLAACQAQVEQPQAKPELAAGGLEEDAVVDVVTAVPNTAVPTAVPTTAPAETKEVVIEPTTETEESVESIESPPGQTVNDYTNVSYTQANADLIGKTNRPQFVLTYATW